MSWMTRAPSSPAQRTCPRGRSSSSVPLPSTSPGPLSIASTRMVLTWTGCFMSALYLLQDSQHFVVDAAVGRDDLRPLGVQGSALEIRDAPAGLLDHEHPRGRVPRADPQFPVTVEPPRRHVAEVEHRGAHASHALTAQAERGELGQVVARRLPDFVGEPRGHQALVQRGRLRYGQALPVPPGAPPPPGPE